MTRVAKFRADQAKEVLECARDCNDAIVINACVRIRQGWLLGHKVAKSDIDIIAEFAE
jgi:hypothetical protein